MKPDETIRNLVHYPKELLPLRQGNLDGLCGLYALINAARLAVPTLPRRTCRRLFQDGAHWLYAKRAFPEVLYEGMTIGKLIGLHKAVIQSTIPALRLKRPFIRSPPTNSKEFWARLDEYTRQVGCGVIIGIESRSWNHWSVAAGISPAKVLLFDSDGRAFLLRSKCSCMYAEETTSYIKPGGILILVATHKK